MALALWRRSLDAAHRCLAHRRFIDIEGAGATTLLRRWRRLRWLRRVFYHRLLLEAAREEQQARGSSRTAA